MLSIDPPGPESGSPVEPLPEPLLGPSEDFEDGDDLADDDAADERFQEAIDVEHQARLWVKVVLSILEHRSHDSDPSDRVQLATDKLAVAACEAAVRLFESVGPRPALDV